MEVDVVGEQESMRAGRSEVYVGEKPASKPLAETQEVEAQHLKELAFAERL